MPTTKYSGAFKLRDDAGVKFNVESGSTSLSEFYGLIASGTIAWRVR